MEVRILGPLEVVADEVVSVGGKTQRRIISMLAAHANAVISVDALVDATWHDEAPKRAGHNIRTYVHRIRTALGGDGERLETLDDGYRLMLEPDELDQARFVGLAQEAARHRRTGALTEVVGTVGEAERLWRGRPLGEFADEPWAQPIVTHLEDVRLGILEIRADSLIGLGTPLEVVGDLQQLVREHSLNERPHMLLMRALAATGRRTESLRVFQDFRDRLLNEVGVEPSVEFYELDRSVAAGSTDLDTPSIYAGAYDIHECVGVGVSAFVHRATQHSVGREVALKIIRPELANEPEFIRRFEAEARTVARVDHPNVVPLYDYWRDTDRAYLVMRHMEGGSLEDRLRDGPLSIEDTVEIIDSLAAALDAAHAIGVIHCDIKPANVLFDGDGRAYLADFGIAHDLFDGIDLTDTDAGTSKSLSPEQIRNEPLGPGVDIHGLGTLAFTALTGRHPFAGQSPDELRRQLLEEPLPSVSAERNDVSPQFDSVLSTATAKRVDERYSSASELAHALRRALDQPDVIDLTTPRHNPYRGLAAFDEPDAGVFHGREELVDDLVEHMLTANGRVLAVVGPSGAGKSSVVRAGLLPTLRRGAVPGSDQWFMTALTPGRHPFESLELALLRIAVDPPPTLLQLLRRDERGLLQTVRRCLPSDDSVLLLVIDQFEELFTNASKDDARAVLDSLVVAATEPGSPVRLVLTLRADFFDRPLEHPGFAALLKQGTVPVPPMRPDELARAIVEPARDVGTEVEEGLVAELISDVAGEPSSLPLLQFALTQAFDHGPSQGLTLDDYHAIGGLRGAIGTKADQTYAALNDAEQEAARGVLGRLVVLSEGSAITARRVPRSELATDDTDQRVIATLGEARLVAFDHDPATREPTVELSHESLAREWPLLRRWLDEDRGHLHTLRHLRRAAADWSDRGEREEDLYRGTRLDAASELRLERPAALTDSEHRFVGMGLDTRERDEEKTRNQLEMQVRSNRNLRRLIAGTAVLLVLALVAAGIALNERSRADSARQEAVDAQVLAETAFSDADDARIDAESASELAASAEADAQKQAFDAETARLVATSGALAETNPRVAMLLARAAWDRESSAETLGALQVALTRAGSLVRHIAWGTAYLDVEVVGDDRVVGLRADGVDLFDFDSGEPLDSFALETSATYAFTTSALMSGSERARVVAVIDDAQTVRAFDVNSSLELAMEVETGNVELTDVAVSPAGDAVFTARRDQVFSAWSLSGDELFSVDLGDERTIYEMVSPVLGAVFPSSDLVGMFPPDGAVTALDDQLIARTGSDVYRLSYSGEVLAGPTTLAQPYLEPVAAVHVLERDDDLVMFGPINVSVLPKDGEWPRLHIVDTIESSVGGGDPSVHGAVLEEDGGSVAILANGSLLRLVDGTEQRIDTSIRLSEASAIAPGLNPDQVVVSHGRGITVASLAGSGPISVAVPRDEGQTTLTINSTGSTVVMSPAASGRSEVALYRIGEDGATRVVDSPIPADAMVANIGPEDTIFSYGNFASGFGRDIHDGDTLEVIDTWDTPALTVGAFNSRFDLEAMGRVGPERILVVSYPARDAIADLDPPELTVFGSITEVDFNPDSTLLLAANRAGKAVMYDTATWEPVMIEELADLDIGVAAWNSSGSLVATGSSGGIVTLRDGRTFAPIRELVGAVGTLNVWDGGRLAFSADDSLLLTNFDGPARLWDVATGEQIGREFSAVDDVGSGINHDADGFRIVTPVAGAALIWDVDFEKWPDAACRAAGSNLSEAEWQQWGPRDQELHPVCRDFPLL